MGKLDIKLIFILFFLVLSAGCIDDDSDEIEPYELSDYMYAANEGFEGGSGTRNLNVEKISLWTEGTKLRGANVWQAVVVPELDGDDFKGSGQVGPPYSRNDFDRLASMGANYVSISGPGLFTEEPPYELDPDVEANLDNLIEMISRADMFVTIGFRTGPGRSEYSLCCGGDPYYEDYFNDAVWEESEAQDAWVEMWKYTAQRYMDNPYVVGYKLMVEPNSNGVFLDVYDPEDFYPEYEGTLYDWNQFYPRIISGIREVDSKTPILVGGMGWSGVEWLPYLKPVEDERTVYIVHQYEPQDAYSHQEIGSDNEYPGVYDVDDDGVVDDFSYSWLDDLLYTVDDFKQDRGAPVGIDEYGVIRWQPGGARYLEDEMELFEKRGLNYALWEWQTSYPPFASEVHEFNFRYGTDPDNMEDVESELSDVIKKYWSKNSLRPLDLMGIEPAPSS